MKWIFKLFCLVMLVIQPVMLTAETEDDLNPQDLRFIFEKYTDVPHGMTNDERDEWKRKLRETPDITNRLYDLLWKYLDARYDREVGGTLSALGERGDLSKEQLKRITDRMRAIAPGPLVRMDMDGYTFICVGTVMLGNYPSPEHEDLALEMLSKNDWRLKMAAATTLGRIGSRKSLEPVRQFYNSQMEKVDPNMRDAMIARYGPLRADRLTEAFNNLERRVNTSERKSSRDTGLHQGDFESNGGISNPVDSDSPSLRNKSIAAIIAGAFAIGAAIWYFLRRRSGAGSIRNI